MARKTFISYKFSESQELRDKIIKKMGNDVTYYNGETAESPNISNTSVKNIKESLKDMIYGTSVMIIIISPNMKLSNWIGWEISYALRHQKRGDLSSIPNKIIGVIQKDYRGRYDWFKKSIKKECGCTINTYETHKIQNIINENRFNLKEEVYLCDTCKTVNWWTGSYISFIEEEDFLFKVNDYVEKTYNKPLENYDISKIE